ncbi:unnamed protein product [Arabidopsis halleri]
MYNYSGAPGFYAEKEVSPRLGSLKVFIKIMKKEV